MNLEKTEVEVTTTSSGSDERGDLRTLVEVEEGISTKDLVWTGVRRRRTSGITSGTLFLLQVRGNERDRPRELDPMGTLSAPHVVFTWTRVQDGGPPLNQADLTPGIQPRINISRGSTRFARTLLVGFLSVRDAGSGAGSLAPAGDAAAGTGKTMSRCRGTKVP